MASRMECRRIRPRYHAVQSEADSLVRSAPLECDEPRVRSINEALPHGRPRRCAPDSSRAVAIALRSADRSPFPHALFAQSPRPRVRSVAVGRSAALQVPPSAFKSWTARDHPPAEDVDRGPLVVERGRLGRHHVEVADDPGLVLVGRQHDRLARGTASASCCTPRSSSRMRSAASWSSTSWKPVRTLAR